MNPDLDYSQLIDIYHSKFLPAYSSLITYVGNKPSQTRSELENILGHLMQTGNPLLTPTEQQMNLERAKCHLIRGTLDCYKLIWRQIQKRLLSIIDDREIRKLAVVGMEEDEFIRAYNEFGKKAAEAREYELANIGKDAVGSIDKYHETAEFGEELLDKIDRDKIRVIKGIRFKAKWKDWIVAGLIGALIGMIVEHFLRIFSSILQSR